MACHGYLQLEGRTFLIEYIVRNCTFPITVSEDSKVDSTSASNKEVRTTCRNILNAFSSTIEGMDTVKSLEKKTFSFFLFLIMNILFFLH